MRATSKKITNSNVSREYLKNGASVVPPSYGLSFIDHQPVQRVENKTGMPDQLKSDVESLSGMNMSDVKVHYNSSQPAQLQAHAYAQGNQIHLAPGQDKHLPHEAWHVVQQKQGRVKPTIQLKENVKVNDDKTLEMEASSMGAKAKMAAQPDAAKTKSVHGYFTGVVQRAIGFEYEIDGAVSERHTPKLFGGSKVSPLYKGEVIANKNGFLVTADEIPAKQGGGSDIEIIINEIDDRSPTGLATLQNTVQRVIEFLTTLDQKVRRGRVNASDFGGKNDVFVGGGVDSGTLQSSVGMSLEALTKFRSGEMGGYHGNKALGMPQYDDPLRSMAADSQTNKHYYLRGYGANTTAFTESLKMVKAYLPKLEPWYQQEIAGIVSVIVMPAVNARVNSPLPYAKASAGAMMARTSFATTLQQLSGPARFQLQHSGDWMNIVVKTITVLSADSIGKPVTPNDPIFPKGSIEPDGDKEVNLQLKIKDWLPHLVAPSPKDTLTTKEYPSKLGDGVEGRHLESMGSFGDKMDPGLTEMEKPRPIFEFRKQLRVPLHHLLDVTEGIWELVHEAHK